MAERSFAKEVEKLRLGEGEEFAGEGILAITKALLAMRRRLCRRLPGRADQPSDGRARRRAGHSRRTRRAFRGVRIRGDRDRHACRLGALSDPGRGHLQVHRRHQRRLRRARQPRVGRRHRRRAADRRRGLRRGLLHHAGAQPRLRHEEPGLAARPAPQPAVDRQGGGGRLRTLRSVEHAGHDGSPHPLLPCARQVHRQGQQAPGDDRRRRARSAAPRHRPHRAAARLLPAREGEDFEALAGRRRLHPFAGRSTSSSARITARSASSCRAACTTPSSARCSASASPTPMARPTSRSMCSTPSTR